MGDRIAAIIPTYNEPDHLQRCVQSLIDQDDSNLTIVVVNAGEPLPEWFLDKVTELKVPDNFFWTSCIDAGVREFRDRCEYILLSNADTSFVPDSLKMLRAEAARSPKIIACSPAYIQSADETPALLYSDQLDWGPLLFGKLNARWKSLADAPTEPSTIDLTGGQGVLIPSQLFREVEMDIGRFPHYTSDHDLWLMAREKRFFLRLVPQAGIINHREFNEQKSQGVGALLKRLAKRLSSPYAPESWPVMWRLRSKHQALPLAVITTSLAFILRWTVGLPKIIKRS